MKKDVASVAGDLGITLNERPKPPSLASRQITRERFGLRRFCAALQK